MLMIGFNFLYFDKKKKKSKKIIMEMKSKNYLFVNARLEEILN